MVQWIATAVAFFAGALGIHPLWVGALIPLGLVGRLAEADWSAARLFSEANGGVVGAIVAATVRMTVAFAVGYVVGMYLGIGAAVRTAF